MWSFNRFLQTRSFKCLLLTWSFQQLLTNIIKRLLTWSFQQLLTNIIKQLLTWSFKWLLLKWSFKMVPTCTNMIIQTVPTKMIIHASILTLPSCNVPWRKNMTKSYTKLVFLVFEAKQAAGWKDTWLQILKTIFLVKITQNLGLTIPMT